MNDESSNWRKDNPQGNVFTGDVSSVSGPSSIPIAPVDPNIFKWSQFLVGLLLIPIFTGFLMSFSAFSAENMLNDQYYSDYSELDSFDQDIINISGDEYQTIDVFFDIPPVDFFEIQEKDFWFSTFVGTIYYGSDGDWGSCHLDMDYIDNPSYLVVQSDNHGLWYPMNCDGSMNDYDMLLQVNGQIFTYAIDQEIELDSTTLYASVDGDGDMYSSGLFLAIAPYLLVLLYIGVIFWSFITKKRSLGFGLLGGILVAPVSFCFSMIILLIFWDM
jgi:hypothetical protein|tara:strand:- start:928 stop:1746 length:819 start_codon:yes stop_codon:yes gene_type:complete